MANMLGVYGGTFDPIHLGHLRPVLEVAEQLNLQKIHFIPSYIPAHRKQPQASIADRVDMIRAAIASEPRFKLDLREIRRQQTSYMFDTLAELRTEFPEHTLVLILGADAFAHFDRWYRWQEILQYCHILITQRPEDNFTRAMAASEQLQHLLQQRQSRSTEQLQKRQSGHIHFLQVTQLPISASTIRHKCKQKQSIRYLLPDPVYDIICQRKLYQD